MQLWQAAVSVLAVAGGLACGELDTVSTQPVQERQIELPADGPVRAISPSSQNPPSGVPEEYQHYTWLDVQVDVGWNDNMAYAQSIVHYGANNATADIELTVRNSQGTVIGSNHGTAQASHVFPGDHVLYASTNVYVSATCGSIAQATAKGSAFDSFFTPSQSTLTWGKKEQSASDGKPQPVCPVVTPPPTSPTGGDGSTPPTTGTSQPPTYQPGPFVPSGHWECYLTYVGTDYETERCTWYADYSRVPNSSPTFSLGATEATARTQSSTDLPSVFVIVSDQVPADAMAVVERHTQGPFKNVLLVPSSTIRPAVLVAALKALADSRGAQGETPGKDLQLTLKGGILDQQIPAAARAYAASFTALIASAKRGQAGVYGVRPILELRLADRK
jgi:hypothetical protein